MLDRARVSAAEMGIENVELHESLIESIPLDDASVDVVISNGVIDLVPDKDAVFDEIDRVLRLGRAAAIRRRRDPPRGLRGRAQAHRSLDRVNRRRVAPG
jgi:ubiquinone/menaquinone biosynthesis C-methylase UbiE